jgi:serine/threonine protein kinase
VVYKCTVADTGDVVGVKKLKQVKKYKSRELAILKEMSHTNVIRMQHAFFTKGDNPEDSILNIVMDYIPMSVHRVLAQFRLLDQPVHPLLQKMYAYQLLRGLAYVHSFGVMHRDIKPANLLVDPTCHILKICDFGSAKKVDTENASVSYITSRHYRAPELVFGTTKYD